MLIYQPSQKRSNRHKYPVSRKALPSPFYISPIAKTTRCLARTKEIELSWRQALWVAGSQQPAKRPLDLPVDEGARAKCGRCLRALHAAGSSWANVRSVRAVWWGWQGGIVAWGLLRQGGIMSVARTFIKALEMQWLVQRRKIFNCSRFVDTYLEEKV